MILQIWFALFIAAAACLLNYNPYWKNSMHYAGCLVDSDALKLGMHDLALKFLNSLRQNF